MAGAQTSEVESILKGFCSDYETVIGYVLMNSDGIPIKFHEKMTYERAVMYSALMSDYVHNCRKSMRELVAAGGDAELQNVRLRMSSGCEIMALSTPGMEYTLVTIQNCSGEPWKWDDEEAAGGGQQEG